MTITSLTFFAYLALFLLVYYRLPKQAQNIWLLVGSYAFLYSWSPNGAITFAILTGLNYVLANQIGKKSPRQMVWLYSGYALNLLTLAYFKYADFFLPALAEAFGQDVSYGALRIAIPVGLSYYFLQAVSYLADTAKGRFKTDFSLLDFAVYMAFFPRVLAGPTENAKDLIPQLAEKRGYDADRIGAGISLIFTGLVRKVVIADLLLLILPNEFTNNLAAYSGKELLVWLLVYSFALYNDFAGYTKIARGAAELLGINLTYNFRVPYLSRSFSEFWQRWHNSLSIWLRAYIFMPLTRTLMQRGLKRNHPLMLAAPPMVTMLVSGLWHGVSWQMVVWGGLHGVYQVGEGWLALRRTPIPPEERNKWTVRRVGAVAVVFALTVLGWIIFWMDLPQAAEYMSLLFSRAAWSPELVWSLPTYLYFVAAGLIGFNVVLDAIEFRAGELALNKLAPLPKAVVLNVLLLLILVASVARSDVPPPFIYQGF